MSNVIEFDQVTMNSKEIADLCKQRHDHVVEKIQELKQEGVFPNLGETKSIKPEGGGRPMNVYNLNKRDTLIIISGYSGVIRARVIDRWIELESKQEAPNYYDPKLASLIQSLVKLDNIEKEQAELNHKTDLLEDRMQNVEIQHRNGVPNGYISKKNAHCLYGIGLSESIFHLALSYIGIPTKNYIHYGEDGFDIPTFAYLDSDIQDAVSIFIEDSKQVTKQMCESPMLNGKRFKFTKAA